MAEEVTTGREIFEEPFKLLDYGDAFLLESIKSNEPLKMYIADITGNWITALYGDGQYEKITAEQINRCATKIYRQGEIIWQRSQQKQK